MNSCHIIIIIIVWLETMSSILPQSTSTHVFSLHPARNPSHPSDSPCCDYTYHPSMINYCTQQSAHNLISSSLLFTCVRQLVIPQQPPLITEVRHIYFYLFLLWLLFPTPLSFFLLWLSIIVLLTSHFQTRTLSNCYELLHFRVCH